MRYYLLLLFLFVLISFKSGVIQENKIQIVIGDQGRKIDSLIVPYLTELRELTNNKAGLAIGVTKGNETIFARCFGYSNIAHKENVDFNTTFHIASVSKPFVAFAIAKLIQEGKINLEDKIVDILPEFQMKDSGYKLITVQHILTHTSGIPANISTDDWTKPSFGEHALDENLLAIQEHTLDFEPGTEFNYSNSAFDILGLVISRVTKMEFSDFISSEIFIPAGMKNTFYKRGKDSLQNMALPYSFGLEDQEWRPYPYNERLFPSSGVLSSLNDILIWTKFHLGKGTYNGKTLLDEKYFNLIMEPQFNTPWNEKIGLSWFLQSYMERPIIMHQGQDTGFESIVYLYPNEDISIVVMANRDFSRTGRIINAISEILFSEKPKSYEVSGKYQFANVYNENGIEKAKEVWLQLATDSTDVYFADDDDLLTMGAILENGEKWKETLDVLSFYTSLHDRSTYAWRLLGNASLNLGDTLSAIQNYNKCLEINPDYKKAKKALESLQMKGKKP